MKEALQYQENPEWRVDLAQMQFNAGDRAAAQKTLREFLFRNPNHQRAKTLAAQVNAAKE
jgi:Tfp pilus assembly protein PilF